MDQPPAVAFTAFAYAWPRAMETEIGAAQCATDVGRNFDLGAEAKYFPTRRWLSWLTPFTSHALWRPHPFYCMEVISVSVCTMNNVTGAS